ncbi:MAG: cysteine hydrolase [Candidatus Moranbacteria bacterium]|nr:cysteine hydrolase [Candidatus Moranbacteria bacterium]
MERLFHSIDIGSVAVLLIDMQDRFLVTREKRNLIPNQIALLSVCVDKGIPVIVVKCEGFGEVNFQLADFLDRIPKRRKITVIKPNEDAFDGTDLADILAALGVTTLLLMGVNACTCVYKTAVSARKRGYEILTSRELIAGNCDEYEHHLQRNHLSRRRDCPDCGLRTEWYIKHVTDEEDFYPVLENI